MHATWEPFATVQLVPWYIGLERARMATRMHLNAHVNALTYIKLLLDMALRSTVQRFRSSEPRWLSTARASFRTDERRCRPSGRVTAEQHTALTDITRHLGLALASWLALARAMHRCPGFPRATHPCDFEENRAAGNNSQNFNLWFSRRQANNSKGPPIRKCRGRSCGGSSTRGTDQDNKHT